MHVFTELGLLTSSDNRKVNNSSHTHKLHTHLQTDFQNVNMFESISDTSEL